MWRNELWNLFVSVTHAGTRAVHHIYLSAPVPCYHGAALCGPQLTCQSKTHTAPTSPHPDLSATARSLLRQTAWCYFLTSDPVLSPAHSQALALPFAEDGRGFYFKFVAAALRSSNLLVRPGLCIASFPDELMLVNCFYGWRFTYGGSSANTHQKKKKKKKPPLWFHETFPCWQKHLRCCWFWRLWVLEYYFILRDVWWSRQLTRLPFWAVNWVTDCVYRCSTAALRSTCRPPGSGGWRCPPAPLQADRSTAAASRRSSCGCLTRRRWGARRGHHRRWLRREWQSVRTTVLYK